MKSLQLTDLKKHETLPNSYQVSLAYKGRKVDLILDNYAYSLQQLLETANNLLISLPDMDSKARRYLAQENIECFNTCREQQQEPTVSEEYLETRHAAFGGTTLRRKYRLLLSPQLR